MFQMRFGNLKNGGAERGHPQPLRHLMTQRAHALRDRTCIVAALTLAGDDKDKPEARRLCVQDEMDKLGVGFGKCHSVQVDAGFGREFAACHLAERFGVHLDGRFRQAVRDGRREVVSGARLGLFAKAERLENRRVVFHGLWCGRSRLGFDAALHGGRVHRLGGAGDRVPDFLFFGAKVAAAGHYNPSSMA